MGVVSATYIYTPLLSQVGTSIYSSPSMFFYARVSQQTPGGIPLGLRIKGTCASETRMYTDAVEISLFLISRLNPPHPEHIWMAFVYLCNSVSRGRWKQLATRSVWSHKKSSLVSCIQYSSARFHLCSYTDEQNPSNGCGVSVSGGLP